MKPLLYIGLLALGSTACTSLQSVSVTNIPRERGKPVEASADNPAFLGLHFDNDFANDLPDELRAQCPNGKVTGIYSKYESTWYVLVQNREVTVKGYCVPNEYRAAAPAPAARPPAESVPAAPAVPSPAPTLPEPPAPPAGVAPAPEARR